jgi:hypothetical protein
MPDLLVTLIPLAAGSAIVPIQIIITILLLRAPGGRPAAVAWVAGMTALRLAQGLIVGRDAGATQTQDGSSVIVSVLLLVLAVLMYVVAVKQWLKEPDEDGPPPRWMTMLDGITPGKAFALGAGLLAIGAKFWVFTLGAIAAIGGAALGQPASTIVFLVWVVMAESILLVILAYAFAAPASADAALARFSDALSRHNRQIVIALGLIFGTWFLLKALSGLGIL